MKDSEVNPYSRLHQMVDALNRGEIEWEDLPPTTTRGLLDLAIQRSDEASDRAVLAEQRITAFSDMAKGMRAVEEHFLAEGKRDDYVPERQMVSTRHGKVARQVAEVMETILAGASAEEIEDVVRNGLPQPPPPKKRRKL